MSTNDLTPIVIGVGEASERIDTPEYKAMSPVELASAAAREALKDAGADVAAHIDLIAAVRQFEVSNPGQEPPFGASNNFPRSVAKRIGADPARSVVEPAGGQGPQHLVNEFAHAIAAGEVKMALLVGSEAISTVRHLKGKGNEPDWSEDIEGQIESRGLGHSGLLSEPLISHGGRSPVQLYALFENARRARMGMDRPSYRLEMGKLFAPFTQQASKNPHAMSQDIYTAEQLATVDAKNRLISDPFPRRMVSRDQANQGAAVLLTSVGLARQLGVPEDRWVYLHGGADVKERTVIERQDLSKSPAAAAALKQALDTAGTDLSKIGKIDLYSCFPIAVENILDATGLKVDDPRGLTLTGGLPFFGGAGTNYSMHAIVSMTQALRAHPGELGLVAANGGFMSKYSVGVYSTTPKAWTGFDSAKLQAEVDAWQAPPLAQPTSGEGKVETYTIDYSGPDPRVLVVGRLPTGERFVAMTGKGDNAMAQKFIDQEPLRGQVTFKADEKGRLEITSFTPA